MDPYLEDPGLWSDVHHELISVSRELLNQRLRPKYHVRIEERVYISDENDPGREVLIRNLRIAQAKRRDESFVTASPAGDSGESGLAVAEPVELTTLIEDEIHEARLEVIDREQRAVVTVIEILRPANKVRGARGRESYEVKRAELMASPSHFVEVDLLRSGVALSTRELLPPADYYVHVSQKQRRPKGLVWPILLTQRLPEIRVPLRPEDGVVPWDLQRVLATAYDRAAYDLEVDYRREPTPPLTDRHAAWADELLRSKGLR
jgi:hypothetical protein